jgi:hypothetical protein
MQPSKLALVVLLTVVSLLATALGVSADPPFAQVTFDCAGSPVVVESNFNGNAFHVVSGPSNFIVTHGVVDGVIVYDVPGQQNRPDLVTCSYIGPFTGRHFTLTGFFTPRH